MGKQQSPSGSSRVQGLELPYKLACKQLSQISDIAEQCRKSGALCLESNKIIIDFLNRPYTITLPGVEISLSDNITEVPLKEKILILHYLISAKGTPATNILINYKQLPGGVSYFPAFSQRAINPLVKHFGQNPESLLDISAKLGGYKAEQGDVSITINPFKYVPIIFVLWRGDDEFSPSGAILFDSNISDYLSTEDITVLCETIIWKLVRNIPSK